MPVVERLQRLCRGHEEGDHGAAAGEMISYLRGAWPDIAEVAVDRDAGDAREADRIVLEIIHDVGEMAATMLGSDSSRGLAWFRANLIVDLESYRSALKAN